MVSFIKNNQFLAISLKNSLQVIVRVFIGILNIKVIAIFLGPTGMAIVSQFLNALQIGVNIANGGINNGIIKYLAQYRSSPTKISLFISTGLILVFTLSLLLGIIVFIAPEFLSRSLFKTCQYSLIIRSSGIYIISTALLNLFITILNGLKQLKSFVLLNLFLSISGFGIILISVSLWGLPGILKGIIFQTTLALFLGFYIIGRKTKITTFRFSWLVIKRLSKFSLMSIIAGVLSPLTLLICRRIIIDGTSLTDAGIWEGINKISTNYILLATLSFSYYFLPRFSEIQSKNKIQQEVYTSFKTIIPLLIVGGTSLFFLKDIIIKLLFTADFTGITHIIHWQILGDGFRILAWVISILLIAKEKVILYIGTELTSSAIQATLTYFFVQHLGIEGSTLAYFLENITSFLLLVVIFHFYLVRDKK